MSTEPPAVEMVRPMKGAEDDATSRFRLIDVIEDFAAGREVFFRYVSTVGDLMSYPVERLTLDDNVESCVMLMQKRGVRHVPLVEVDEESGAETFVGIISSRDVARQLSKALGSAGEVETDQQMLSGSLSSVVTRNPVTVAPTDGLFDAVGTMVDRKIDCLPVIDSSGLVGVLTSTDVIRTFLRLNLLQRLTGDGEGRKARLIDLQGGRSSPDSKLIVESHFKHVGDVMTAKPTTVAMEATLADAMRLMREGRFRHLPVVDAKGALTGVVSDRDVLHALPPMAAQAPAASDGEPGWRDKLFAVPDDAEALKSQVRLFMTGRAKLLTAPPDGTVVDAVNAMLINGASCILVVDEDDPTALLGILTTADLMRGVAVLGQMMTVMTKD